MQLQCTLLAVRDLEQARKFYTELLGLEVTADFGANIVLSERLSLQAMDTWADLLEISQRDIIRGHHACELYFETDDLDTFLKRLAQDWSELRLVHPVKVHAWGQRVVRLYDPDHNVVEVGESMRMVVRRILEEGMTEEEAARRMDVPLSYVQDFMRTQEDGTDMV